MAEAEASGNGSPDAGANTSGGEAQTAGELAALVDRLEHRVRSLLDETGRSAVDQSRKRIEENPITAVLIALGLGLLVGLVLGRGRG